MKTTTIIAPLHAYAPAAEIPKANSIPAVILGTLLLAGIVFIGAALLALGLLSWPIRLVRRRIQMGRAKG